MTGGLVVSEEELASSLDLPTATRGTTVRSPTYGPLKAGDKVICVSGWQYPRISRHARLEFIGWEMSLLSGKSWLVCWGTRDRQAQWLYFQPGQIRPA